MNLRFGIIGVGYFGKHYVRLLQEMEGVELVCVATRSASFDREIQNFPATIKRCASADELLSSGDIDCVVIATPVSTHADFAVAALNKGKHVLLEKPMASTLTQAKQIAAAVEKSGRVFMIGHQYCYNDYIRQLKKEIESKTIGDISYCFAQHLYAGPVRLDIGCFWETATHELAIIDYLFPGIKMIHASGQSVDMMQSGRDDATTAVIAFDNGLSATIITSWFAPQKVRRMIMAGAKGQVVFDEKETHPLVFYTHPYPLSESPEPHTSHFFEITDQEKYIPDIQPCEPLRNQLDHFIECIREQKTPLTGIEHGMRVTGMLDQVTISIKRENSSI